MSHLAKKTLVLVCTCTARGHVEGFRLSVYSNHVQFYNLLFHPVLLSLWLYCTKTSRFEPETWQHWCFIPSHTHSLTHPHPLAHTLQNSWHSGDYRSTAAAATSAIRTWHATNKRATAAGWTKLDMDAAARLPCRILQDPSN